jgi:hypothetical protein
VTSGQLPNRYLAVLIFDVDKIEQPIIVYRRLPHSAYSCKRVKHSIAFEGIISYQFINHADRKGGWMLRVVRRLFIPQIGYLITIFDPRLLYGLLVRMVSYIPINQFLRRLAIDKKIFCHGHWLILQWLPVSSETPTPAGIPAGSGRFRPNNVIKKFKSYIFQHTIDMKRHGYSFA